MKISVRVVPNSRVEAVEKVAEGAYRAKVKAKPIEGRANERLILLLSEYFAVPKSQVRITRGLGARDKTVEIVQA